MSGVTIQWDNTRVLSRPSTQRKATHYLRGTVVAVAGQAGTTALNPMKAMENKRCLIWGDTTDLDTLEGKVVDANFKVRDFTCVEDTNQPSYTLQDLSIIKSYDAEETAAVQALTMAASFLNLEARGARNIPKRPSTDVPERPQAGDIGGHTAEALAGEAAVAVTGAAGEAEVTF